MSRIAETLIAAWRWWSGELLALVPGQFREIRKPRPSSSVMVGRRGVTIDRTADGVVERFHETRRLEELDEDGWAELGGVIAGTRPKIVLTTPDAYWTELTLPTAARGRLRSAVAFQMPRIAPLDPEELAWNSFLVESNGSGLKLVVAMVRKQRLAEIESAFLLRDMAMPPVAAEAGDVLVEISAGTDDLATLERRRNFRAALLALLLLATIPVTTWIGAAFLTGLVDRRVAAVEEEIAPKLRRERKIEADERVRLALHTVLDRRPASEWIEALAIGLPDTDHAVSAEADARGNLRFDVDSADPAALKAALAKAPALAGATQVGEPAPAAPGRSRVSFTVEAQ